MRYLYKDLLEGQPCCESCDNWVEVDFGTRMFCPQQEQLVRPSGHCEAYDGFWRLVNDSRRKSMGEDRQAWKGISKGDAEEEIKSLLQKEQGKSHK